MRALDARRKTARHAIDAFDAGVRTSPRLPYLCDDVFYMVIVPMCMRHSCVYCHRWVGTPRGLFACYRGDGSTLCFRCRHQSLWPRT